MASRKKPPYHQSSSMDEQFEAFLKASLGSDSDTSLSKYLQPKSRKERPWWQSSMDTSEEFDQHSGNGTGGLGGSTKSFLKKPSIIPPIVPKSSEEVQVPKEQPQDQLKMKESTPQASFLKEITSGPFSIDDATEPTNGDSTTRPSGGDEFRESLLSYDQSTETGQDTLEEAYDKSKFFKKLNEEADATIDYSHLNRQLGTTADDDSVAQPLDRQEKDFTEGESIEVPDTDNDNTAETSETPARTNLLANVSLNDTLDTSLAGASGPTVDQSGGMGNTSQLDYEAVQQAYQDIHDKEATVQSLPVTTQQLDTLQTATNDRTEIKEGHAHHRDKEHMGTVSISKAAGESSQATSVWDLQPVTEAEQSSSTFFAKAHSSASSSPPQSPPHSKAADSKPTEEVSVWDLQPVTDDVQAEQPSIESQDSGAKHDASFATGRTTPTTVVGYQTIDQLSPILYEKAFPFPTNYDAHQHSSLQSPKTEKGRPLGKTQTLRRSLSTSKSYSSANKYSHVKSSGYGASSKPAGSKSSGSRPVGSKSAGSKSSGSKSAGPKSTGHRPKSIKKSRTDPDHPRDPVQLESSPVKVLQSVESFASYLRDQLISSTPADKLGAEPPAFQEKSPVGYEREAVLLAEIKEWQQKWREECRMREKVTADYMTAKKQWEMISEETRLRHEQQASRLQQEIYILQTKKTIEAGVANEVDTKDVTTNQIIDKLKAEIDSQERLISGYQQENERLYSEVKQSDSLNKQTYDKLYQENLKIAGDNAQLREQLAQMELALKGKTVQIAQYTPPKEYTANIRQQPNLASSDNYDPISQPMMTAALGAGRIADLKSQLTKSKGDLGDLAAQVSRLSQEKTELITKLQYITQERDKLKDLMITSKQPAELRVIQDRYQQEINVLEKKVKWYIENQRLLDTDVEKLRQKDCEINELRNKIKQLEDQREKPYDAKQRSRDRTADAKRIKDLERQVKELEQIVRKRNPNSIPSILWAASLVPDQPTEKPPTIKFLEEQVAKLEKDLEEKDSQTSRLLRSMQQQCNQSNAVYEQRIRELEEQVSKKEAPSKPGRHTTISALEKELEASRRQFSKKLQDQEEIINELKAGLKKTEQKEAAQLKSETRVLRQSKEAGDIRMVELEEKLENKMSEISALHDTIERLQKEKRQLLVELNHVQSVKTAVSEKNRTCDQNLRLKTSPRKEKYTPENFTEEHISDVLALNKSLAIKYEESQLEISELRVEHQRQLAKLESQIRENEEKFYNEVEKVKNEKEEEKHKIIAEHAMRKLQVDDSKYKSQVETLESVIKHLKEDRKQWQIDTEELSVLRIRNVTLDHQIKHLEQRLEEAKDTQTPEIRRFERLKDKISAMEERFTRREEELKQMISENQIVYQKDLQTEILKWKNIVRNKNKDIERFRSELDSILGVLTELGKQGIVLPSLPKL